MSNVGPEGRSFKRIRHKDLLRIASIAEEDRAAFFSREPGWAKFYADRLIAVALCQGAALHYVDGRCGIQDFDVYTFFARHPARAWYARRNMQVDFGDPYFGTSLDKPGFVGRRVDLLGRSLDAAVGEDPAAAIRSWLRNGRGRESSVYLAKKAVVLLLPLERCGEVVWPEHREDRSPQSAPSRPRLPGR